MPTIQLETRVPDSGNVSIAVPQTLWGKNVTFNVSMEETTARKKTTVDIREFFGTLPPVDTSDIRDEEDREI
ncbi:hypothetical protein FACS1894158_09190 [Betaproteobacteria bacterium]|nr:hypothetical protein FACS1894158_09190 [Betaproteobacteria bacterium]